MLYVLDFIELFFIIADITVVELKYPIEYITNNVCMRQK